MAGNTYFIDKDAEEELARLILQDKTYSLLLDLLPKEFVPAEGKRVLDLACGPGGWALDVASSYPLSMVGIDLSEQMIMYARAQAQSRGLNVQFSIMDLLRFPWPFPDEHFSFVNARFITSLTPANILPHLYQECYRVLSPGGVIRYTEGSFLSCPCSPANQRLTLLACEATYRAGLSASPMEMAMAPITARILKSVGFQHVSFTPYILDISYNEPSYRLMKENWLMSIQLMKPFLTRMKVSSPEEIDSLLKQFLLDWNSPEFSAYYHLCSLTGIKE